MSVIAWDGKTLAADRQAGVDLPRAVTKIRRTRNGALMGATGTACGDQELMAWYDSGAVPGDFPATHRDTDKGSFLLVIEKDRTIHVYQGSPYSAVFHEPYHAMGSGRDFAMAAMYLGKTAQEAVEITCALTAYCGKGVDTLELEV